MKKIKTYNDFVSEGFWKSGIKRAKTGELRKEDEPITNINEIKGVDIGLPFLVADRYLEVMSESTHLNYFDIEGYTKLIQKYGWRIPNAKDALAMMSSKVVVIKEPNSFICLKTLNSKRGIMLGNTLMLGVWVINGEDKYMLSSKDRNENYNDRLQLKPIKLDDKSLSLIRLRVLLVKDKN